MLSGWAKGCGLPVRERHGAMPAGRAVFSKDSLSALLKSDVPAKRPSGRHPLRRQSLRIFLQFVQHIRQDCRGNACRMGQEHDVCPHGPELFVQSVVHLAALPVGAMKHDIKMQLFPRLHFIHGPAAKHFCAPANSRLIFRRTSCIINF